MAKIIAIIDPKTGESKITAEGYNGPTCQEKTRPFTEKLGLVTEDTPTNEMHNVVEEQQNEQTYG